MGIRYGSANITSGDVDRAAQHHTICKTQTNDRVSLTITIIPDERVPHLFRVVASEPASTIEATMHADILGTWINETVASWTEMLVECNTCGGTGEWETTTEESPDELVSLGPCPDC